MNRHEIPMPGPAAEFAAGLRARLPVLDTPRTRLRPPVLADFDAWAEVLCGPSTGYLGGPFDRDDAFMEFAGSVGGWLLRGHGPWTVEDKETGEVLGFVILGFEPGDDEVELGYLFRPSAEGRGLAFEAASAARDHALSVLNLPALVSYVAEGNTRSDRLAARLGARADGVLSGCTVWRHHPRPTTSAQGALA